MHVPSIKHVIRDDARNVTFEVVAYRKLTKPEVQMVVDLYLRNGLKVRKNRTYEMQWLGD